MKWMRAVHVSSVATNARDSHFISGGMQSHICAVPGIAFCLFVFLEKSVPTVTVLVRSMMSLRRKMVTHPLPWGGYCSIPRLLPRLC